MFQTIPILSPLTEQKYLESDEKLNLFIPSLCPLKTIGRDYKLLISHIHISDYLPLTTNNHFLFGENFNA